MFILKYRGGQTFRRKIYRDKLLSVQVFCIRHVVYIGYRFHATHSRLIISCNNGELLIEYIITGTYYLYLLT